MKKRCIFVFVMTFILTMHLFVVGLPATYAHESILTVTYDNCVIDADTPEGIDEMWYILESPVGNHHIGQEITTIRYCFEEINPLTGCTWVPAGESQSAAEEIKTAFANSIKKWNNVYFYAYTPDGSITKNKVINIVEATDEPYNLRIRPVSNTENSIASARYLSTDETTMQGNHKHHPQWIIDVNINFFFENSPISGITPDEVNQNKAHAGAHEFGHILGLCDIDVGNRCGANARGKHHSELLMGYADGGSSDITYKDIAGVAITRGFHTDNDHKWLNMGQQSDGTYKLVCSICNGVKYVEDLNDYSYETYGDCGNHHTLSSGNMMAVASYLSRDYYKCKYCRYVAPFANRVSQNYRRCYFSEEFHKCVNDVNGLKYVFYEPHTLVNGECTKCGPHIYDKCVYINTLSHQSYCACGAVGSISQHYLIGGVHDGSKFAPCGGCGYLIPVVEDGQIGIMSAIQVSVNGSYILPSGIVVLVEEDIEAYLAGTLQFYHPEDVPVTQ